MLVNAAQAIEERGKIIIKTYQQDKHVCIEVIDTGKGIAPEDLSKLFQKFQQIESGHENEEGGTGLGLAICKEIVTRHGGKIWAESQPGVGTSFKFLLPIQERRVTQ